MTDKLLLTALALIASVSPLLTLTWLWQVKEWRFDRLREHLRSEGCGRQLFGAARPAVVLVFALVMTADPRPLWLAGTLGLLAALTPAQALLRRQRRPVWTQKAVVLAACAALFDLALAAALLARSELLLPLLPLLQPLPLLLAWAAFLPVDSHLKRKRMRQAQALRAAFADLTVVGVTGSVGKTTVKELLACALHGQDVLATPAHVNSEMGVANWMLKELSPRKANPPRALIVEMGAYRTGEIARLCAIAQPTMGVVTFVGKQHIALFGSEEALCRAKGELIESLSKEGTAFLNADNEACMALAQRAACKVVTAGTGGPADIEAFDIEETPTGIAFRIGETRFSVPLHGTHNVVNVLLSLAVARSLGMKDADTARALASYRPPKHTFSVRSCGQGITVLDDTHNASPASFKAAIAWARSRPAKHKVLLTSGLMELGAAQDGIHTELGGTAAGVFDRVIFLHRRNAKAFEKGYGPAVEQYSAGTAKIGADTLLACVGRMPAAAIQRLLP